MENGKMGSNMEMECGEARKEIATLENGFSLKRMGTELMLGPMVTDMRECGTCASNMGEGQIFLQMGTTMLANTRMESQKGREPILGQMEAHMLGVSLMG